jgi:hypothetical protein
MNLLGRLREAERRRGRHRGAVEKSEELLNQYLSHPLTLFISISPGSTIQSQ